MVSQEVGGPRGLPASVHTDLATPSVTRLAAVNPAMMAEAAASDDGEVVGLVHAVA